MDRRMLHDLLTDAAFSSISSFPTGFQTQQQNEGVRSADAVESAVMVTARHRGGAHQPD